MNPLLEKALEIDRKTPYKSRYNEDGGFPDAETKFNADYLHEPVDSYTKPPVSDEEINELKDIDEPALIVEPENKMISIDDISDEDLDHIKSKYKLVSLSDILNTIESLLNDKEEILNGDDKEMSDDERSLSSDSADTIVKEGIWKSSLTEDANALAASIKYAIKLGGALSNSLDKSSKLSLQDLQGMVDPSIYSILLLVLLSGDPDSFMKAGAALKSGQNKILSIFASTAFEGDLRPIAQKLLSQAKSSSNTLGQTPVLDKNAAPAIETPAPEANAETPATEK